jgi:hypothetical protein
MRLWRKKNKKTKHNSANAKIFSGRESKFTPSGKSTEKCRTPESAVLLPRQPKHRHAVEFFPLHRIAPII